MGGPGSGRWYRGDKRPTLEELCCLDIRLLKRHGLLQPGSSTLWSWSCGAQSAGSVLVGGAEGAVVLVYPSRVSGGPLEALEAREEIITLDWTEAHGGGQRPWFLCPACARRVALIYSAGTGFICRHCVQLPYTSQCELPPDRSFRKLRKIRRRLGVSESLLESVDPWRKPKGMPWRTFERLLEQEEHAEMAAWRHLHAWSTRFLGQCGEES